MSPKSPIAGSIWDVFQDEVALLAAWIGDWKRYPKRPPSEAVESFEGLSFYQILDINPEDVMSEELKVNLLSLISGGRVAYKARKLTEERPFNIIQIRTLRIFKARLSALQKSSKRTRYVLEISWILDSARLTYSLHRHLVTSWYVSQFQNRIKGVRQ